jgi:hypothetical protein
MHTLGLQLNRMKQIKESLKIAGLSKLSGSYYYLLLLAGDVSWRTRSFVLASNYIQIPERYRYRSLRKRKAYDEIPSRPDDKKIKNRDPSPDKASIAFILN